MKGIVFTEFLEMVEDAHGLDVVDRLLEAAGVDGAYTSVGTYDHAELIGLVTALAGETGADPSELVRTFGRHLFDRFVEGYPQFFDGVPNAIEFLARIEDYIHVEVRKLYADAELPTFDHTRMDDGAMELLYRSPRPFGDFAQGLIEGCVRHFGEEFEIVRQDESAGEETRVRFRLRSASPV